MWRFRGRLLAVLGATCLILLPVISRAGQTPSRVVPYFSGPPCELNPIDRTFSQFQVNVAPEAQLVRGRLQAGAGGEAVLVRDSNREIQLLSNASRADWLLSYPNLVQHQVGVWGRPILLSDCSVAEGTFYLEALFPLGLLQGDIPADLDLMKTAGTMELQEAVRHYRRVLEGGGDDADPDTGERPDGTPGAASRFGQALFSPESASAEGPWRVLLHGSDDVPPDRTSVDILLSGSDGSVGMFGHIAVGRGGLVYNVYPKGSDKGAPGPVALFDYLFNAQRGQALSRPTWILRLQGMDEKVLSEFQHELLEQIDEIQKDENPYHPTANNCTTVSLKALKHLGIEVAKARYFTRRFPRPAFLQVLARLPRLLETGKLKVARVELAYVPQVPVRMHVGGAPNRPLRDRARMRTEAVVRFD